MRPETPHSPQALGGPNLALVHSKVVGDFVPKRLLDQAFEVVAVTSEPLVGALEYRNPVGQLERLENTAVRQRPPFV